MSFACRYIVAVVFILAHGSSSQNTYYTRNFDCGPYGFMCESNNKLRLCEGGNLFGPPFLCPANTICNEESSDVCENFVNYIDPALSHTIRCRRNERIADPNVPGCKGYILCIPNKNRLQGIKFKCSGDTIFNGFTRTCSSPNKYTCPISNTTKTTPTLFTESKNRRVHIDQQNFEYSDSGQILHKNRPIDCKNYKFTVTQDKSPVKAAYFCPPRPVQGERTTRCTVFSNQFCMTLERYEEDQFIHNVNAAYRRPRLYDEILF